MGGEPLFTLGPELVLVAWILLAFLAAFGMPLFAVIAAGAMICLQSTGGDFVVIFVKQASIANVPLYIAIPLFTFAGTILSESRTPTRIVNLARACFGWLPGSLSIVAVVACAFFTAFTGASGVTIIALGGLLFPILIKEKYPERFSLGLLTTGGSLGLLWPPSLPLILYALYANRPEAPISVEGLFRAGIVPGTLLVGVLAVYCYRVGKRSDAPVEPFSWGKLGRALKAATFELPVPVIIFGGIYGWFEIESLGFRFKLTPAEASAVTALYVLVAQFILYRDVSFKKLPDIVRRTVELVGAIFIILGAAMGLTNYMITERVPDRILSVMRGPIANQPELIQNSMKLTEGDPTAWPGFFVQAAYPEKMPDWWQEEGYRPPARPGPGYQLIDALYDGYDQLEKLEALKEKAGATRNRTRWEYLATRHAEAIQNQTAWIDRLARIDWIKRNLSQRFEPPDRPEPEPDFDRPFDEKTAGKSVQELCTFGLSQVRKARRLLPRLLEEKPVGGSDDLVNEFLDPESGYVLWVPDGWTEVQEAIRGTGLGVALAGPEKKIAVNVYVEQLSLHGPYPDTESLLARLPDLGIQRYRAVQVTGALPDSFPEAGQPLEKEPSRREGLDGVRVSFEKQAPDGTTVRVDQYLWRGNQRLFILTTGAPADDAEATERQRAIAKSFENIEPIVNLMNEAGFRSALSILESCKAWLETKGRPDAADLELLLEEFEPHYTLFQKLGGLEGFVEALEELVPRARDAGTSYGELEKQVADMRQTADALPRLETLGEEAKALKTLAGTLKSTRLQTRLEELAKQVDEAASVEQPIRIEAETLAAIQGHLDRIDSVIWWARVSFLLVLNMFLLIVGCLMDVFSAILVVVPLIVPLAIKFGVNPYHLGIIFLTNLEIGYSTPPVGINLFIASLRFERPVVQLYLASIPFLLLLGICLLVITYVPWLTLLLV